jgi:3-oxoacyl-[acyl-carrier-protein] synthase II
MKKRIVVTGMGVVSCFGSDVDMFYQSLLQGKSGACPIVDFDVSSYSTRFAALVSDFDVGEYLDKKQARRVDPFIRYAVVAGKKALEHAGIVEHLPQINLSRVGVIIGSGMGGMSIFSDGVETLLQKGFKRLTPFFIPYIITNMGGAVLAIDYGFQGPNYSISTACATASHSIYAAASEIQKGAADVMVCGGVEAPVTPIGLSGFMAIRALSTRNEEPTRASRPFDCHRDGFVMGEGAAVLVLESLEHALERGAPILAEYLGGANNCDAYHMTDPLEDGSGVARCIENALLDADVAKERVNYVNAHATSTLAGDLCEVKALLKVFGAHAKNIRINATKSMIGHTLGAAGGMASVVTINAILTGRLHPNLNLENPEPLLNELAWVGSDMQPCEVDVGLCNAFGFGGHNAVLAWAPYRSR